MSADHRIVRRPADCHLQLLFSSDLCRGDPLETLRAALRGGVDLVQIREKQMSTEQLLKLAGSILPVAEEFQVPVLINDNVEVAAQLPVAGVHLGQRDTSVPRARVRLGPGAWIGVSTHDAHELNRALTTSATHLGLGACFATDTRAGSEVIDHDLLEDLIRRSPLPVFAIGGITAGNAPELRARGARRLAVSSALLQSEDPEKTARQLRSSLDYSRANSGQS